MRAVKYRVTLLFRGFCSRGAQKCYGPVTWSTVRLHLPLPLKYGMLHLIFSLKRTSCLGGLGSGEREDCEAKVDGGVMAARLAIEPRSPHGRHGERERRGQLLRASGFAPCWEVSRINCDFLSNIFRTASMLLGQKGSQKRPIGGHAWHTRLQQ